MDLMRDKTRKALAGVVFGGTPADSADAAISVAW